MSDLALFLLGPPRIERDGEPVEIRRRKAMALVVYLAVTGCSHSRDALATLLWPELDQSRALTALRKSLGEGWLDVDRETAGLDRAAEMWLDVAEFHGQLATCRTHGPPEEKACPARVPLLAEGASAYSTALNPLAYDGGGSQ
jgi:DNA-binding SARP family transcriptional activator